MNNSVTISGVDVIRYNKAQLRRAKTNLINAEKRGDKRAAAHIRRKIAIYQYTIDLAKLYIDDGAYINKKIAEAGEC